MFKIIELKNDSSFITLIFILLLTFLVYQPGLKGGFLFDDYYNLAEMSRYGDPHDWNAAEKFITQGGSGPTGRPVALASFLIHVDSWTPENGWLGNARPFKTANLCIHLTCGFLLFFTIKLLLRSYGYREKKLSWIALIATSFWLLHPLFVSTTLYVIQRMAQLPLLFSLMTMIGYLRGRSLLPQRSLKAYFIMTLSIGMGTVLATFSKENGALLPLLILVIEFCNPNHDGKPIWQWRAICLWLPAMVIIALLIRYIDFSQNPWPNRIFNQTERLWSEGRIVVDYLKSLWIPRIEGTGLLQDGFNISKGWLNPISTLYSALFLLILLITGFYIRLKYPLIALAILFFFAAHLMESTFIGLELYFEHRNYLAAIFMFLPLSAGLVHLSTKIKPSVVMLITVLILITLTWMTWQRTTLWSDNNKLQLYWAKNNPESERGQVFMSKYMIEQGSLTDANRLLEQALERHPNSGLLAFQLLLQKIKDNTATSQDFNRIAKSILEQRSDPQALICVRDIVVAIISDKHKAALYAKPMLKILNAFIKPNSPYWDVPQLDAMISLLKGLLSVADGQPDEGYKFYSQAILKFQDIDKALAMVSDLGNHGYREQALQLLNMAEAEYNKQPDKNLTQSRDFFEKKINELRKNIEMDLHNDLNKTVNQP